MAHSATTAGARVETARTRPRPLRLPGDVRAELIHCAVEGYPHEVCGLLVGTDSGSAIEVRRITRARNLSTERLADRYTLDPDDFVGGDTAARRDGLEVVGIWHTHPDHPARPSQTDLEAAWEGYSYLILSVGSGGVADVTSWRLDGDGFVEQAIEEAQ